MCGGWMKVEHVVVRLLSLDSVLFSVQILTLMLSSPRIVDYPIVVFTFGFCGFHFCFSFEEIPWCDGLLCYCVTVFWCGWAVMVCNHRKTDIFSLAWLYSLIDWQSQLWISCVIFVFCTKVAQTVLLPTQEILGCGSLAFSRLPSFSIIHDGVQP